MTFILAPMSGDPDIYIGNSANPATRRPNTTQSTYIWSGTNYGADVVTIAPGSQGYCAPCTYYVGVFGWDNATFRITARSGFADPMPLVYGVSQPGVVAAGSWDQYYSSFDWSAPTVFVQLSTQFGDPDLYVYVSRRSQSARFVPVNFTNAIWASSNSSGSELISISQSDPRFQAACGASPSLTTPCVISIGVYGWGSNSGYTVSVSSASRELSLGVPLTSYAQGGQYVYFSFTAMSLNPFTITLTSLSGDADLYIALSSYTEAPNATRYQWLSISTGVDSVTIIPSVDPITRTLSSPIDFSIGVNGFGGPAAFRITATSESSVTALSDGRPVSNSASARGLQLYSFWVPSGYPAGFEVTATPTWGGPLGVVINNAIAPAPRLPACGPPCRGPGDITNYIWSSNTSAIRSRVTVRTTDGAWRTGRLYYIGVYAAAASSYTVTASFLNSIIQLQVSAVADIEVRRGQSRRDLLFLLVRILQLNSPLVGGVLRGAYAYYRMTLLTPSVDASISVTPLVGDPGESPQPASSRR